MCDSGQKLKQVVDGYQNMEKMTGALDSGFGQKGGGVGYVLDIEKPFIGGKAAVVGYDSAPEYREGSLVGTRTESGMLMGAPDQCGGAKKKGKLSGKKHNNNNPRMNNNEALNNNKPQMNNNAALNNVRMNVQVNNKPKKSKKKSQKRKHSGRKYSHKKKHSGKKHKKNSNAKSSQRKSKRKGKGKYHRKNRSKNQRRFKRGRKKMTGGSGCQYERLADGQESVFTTDMSQRTFEGKQPNWQPSDV